MPIIPDGDLLAFLWTTAVVIFGSKAQIKKNSRRVPLRYTLEELSESQLTSAQREYLRPIDAQLEAMNYRPECTFRATNYGQNLMRRYSNPADPASCELTIIEVRSKVGSVETVKNANVLSFTTRLSDGRRLITRNMPVKSVMDRLPHQILQDCPHVTDISALKRRHDSRAAQLPTPLSPPYGASAVFAEMQTEHERFSAYQVQQGIYRLSPDGNSYEITNKVANRGIRNFFNPFAGRASIPLVLFTALTGTVLPLFGILRVAPFVTANSHSLSLGPLPVSTLAIVACYALAGAIIGLSGGPSNYAWLMLITYVPAHLVAGWAFGWFPFTTVAHLACHYFRQARQRRALVLQT